jgi:hypothetical protein
VELSQALGAFNRKERFLLVGWALDRAEFTLGAEFRERLGEVCGTTVPDDAFVAMDYHLDWLYAALLWADGKAKPGVPHARGREELLTASQEDVDLLVAFATDEGHHVVLCEAKGFSGWQNRQLQSKVRRLKAIFGDTGGDFDGVEPHFVLVGPTQSARIATAAWPEWMWPKQRVGFLTLPNPGPRYKVTRCDAEGRSRADRWTHWKIEQAHWAGAVADQAPLC